MKAFSNYRDIRITFDASRESWIADLRPLGLVPGRPYFNTKTEATEAAKAAFSRWLDQDGDDGLVVAPKTEISVGECFDRFLEKSKERAGNPDERFGWGSYQNQVDHRNRLRGLTVDGARLEKMMLKQPSRMCPSYRQHELHHSRCNSRRVRHCPARQVSLCPSPLVRSQWSGTQ